MEQEQQQFKVMRAWDKGHNKIRYVYHDENMRARIGETTFINWFYVKTSDYDERRDVFTRLVEDKSLVRCEKDGKYTKCFYNTVHESEFLTKDMEYDWGYKSFSKNKMLEKLDLLDIQTYEADVSASKRWLLQHNVTVEDDYKVLYYDIETDDRHGKDSLTPGKYRILSIAMKSSDNHNADGKMMWLYCHEDTDESECEFLQKVAKVFRAHDCIIAFNGSNFDDLYIKSRFARYGIEVDWRTKFLQDACWTFKKYGPNLPKHNLDYIGNYILKRGKVEHTGESIYGMWQNNLPLLKEYNIEDVQLMYDIECKTGYLNAHRGVCSVGMCPVDDLYILHKIDNFVLKQADEDKHYHFKTVVRNQEETENEKTYEGAFVFDPIPGLHTDVKVLDFSSLYPNVINTFNISPDTFIEPEDLKSIPADMVITTGTQHKFRKDFVGILPKVVMALKSKRDYWKEKMSHETPGSVMHKVYDRMQYLYKYFGLSFYGCLGEKHSRFYDTRIAEAVTLTGQMFTKTCARYVEKKHGARIIYGDSVTGERCTVIRDTIDGSVKIVPFKTLFDIYSDYYIENVNGKEYKTFKQHPLEALSYNFKKKCSEFKPIKCVMRHKTDKKIYLYRQRDGVTVCTQDHSLIDSNGNEFKPTDGFNGFTIPNIAGKKLKSTDLVDWISQNDIDTLSQCGIKIEKDCFRYNWHTFKRNFKASEIDDLIYVIAHYICNGSASTKETTSRYGFTLSNKRVDLLNNLKDKLETMTTGFKFGIIEADKRSHTYRLQTGDKLLATLFSVIAGQKYNGKMIPNFIFNLPVEKQKVFVDAMIDGDGYIENGRYDFESASVNVVSGMAYLYRSVGYNLSVDANKSGTFTAKMKFNSNCGRHLVKNVLREVPNDGQYVYDLTVEDNHNFVDAMGNLLLHNTDSFFFHDDYFCQGHDRMEELSKELSKLCYHIAVKKNNCAVCTLKMSYDKGFKKYLILNGKKRYAGVIDYLDGHVINDFNMYIAGLEYKRTDTCKFVKEHQYELLKMILTDTPDAKTVRNYILKLKDSVCSGKLSLEEITFAQKLTKNVEEYADQIHVRVAREMIADGEAVYVGDKIPYFIISVGTDGKPIAKPVYKFKGKYSTQYYWNNKMFPPLQRILEVVYPKVDWEGYLITGGKNVSFGRTNLW